MALEKRRVLRKIEFILTDDEINADCHCAFEDQVVEDGNVIMKENHRETHPSLTILREIQNKSVRERDLTIPG